METNQDHSLIPQEGRELTTTAGRNRILGEMVEQTLALGREEVVAQTPKFKIGDYIWCEPDYRQILLWADALKIEPAKLIEKLITGEKNWLLGGTVFHDGRIQSLSWNLAELPLSNFISVEGLTIRSLYLYGSELLEAEDGATRKIFLRLPRLQSLCCKQCKIEELTLSSALYLTLFWCDGNRFKKLILFEAPNLTELYCSDNQLTALKLSCIPKLRRFKCSKNQLTALELSHVPELRNLECSENEITELDISHVPSLKRLGCGMNQITKLELFNVPKLLMLWCSRNQIKSLDLTNVPQLVELSCEQNQLTELDIRPLPFLDAFDYDDQSVRLFQRLDQHY